MVVKLSAGAAISACRFQPRHRRLCARGTAARAMRNAELGYGNERVRRCDSVGVIAFGARLALWFYCGACRRFAVGIAALAGRLRSVRVRSLRSCRGFALSRVFDDAVLAGCFASVYVQHCGSVAALFLGSRLLFVLRQTGRLAIRSVPIPPGRDRHSCVLAALFGYLPRLVHFGFVRFFMAISTGYEGRSYEGHGARGWRRGAGAHCVSLLALTCFPRGERWGCAPQTAPKSLRLSGLSSRCGGVGLVRVRGAAASLDSLHGAGRRGNAEWLFSNSNSAFRI